MAGYRKAGSEDFVNATTFNKQIVRQREEYQGGSISEMGVYNKSSVFPDMRSDIFDSSVNTMNSLDITSELGNPDFSSQIDFSNRTSLSIYDDLGNAVDKPNKKGPNLIAPDINNLSAPTQNQASISEDRQNKGFGWRDDRNEPATPAATIGTYFSRHYNSSGQNSDVLPPILGEAKSPEDDQNIKYNQP